MKQSKSKKGREATAFLYERLSRDDEKSKVHKLESFPSDTGERCRFFY